MTEHLPMFPLGSLLVPHMLLPLRVFEPRYLQMVDDLQHSGGEFGVVLIERGFEVGGGDARFDVGTVARLLEVSELDGGHLLVVSAGIQRLRVTEWLADDPYPRAVIERLDDVAPATSMGEPLERLGHRLRRIFGLMSELGYDVAGIEVDLSGDPAVASYQGMMLAPLSTMDRQDLLQIDDVEARLQALLDLAESQVDLFRQQLEAG